MVSHVTLQGPQGHRLSEPMRMSKPKDTYYYGTQFDEVVYTDLTCGRWLKVVWTPVSGTIKDLGHVGISIWIEQTTTIVDDLKTARQAIIEEYKKQIAEATRYANEVRDGISQLRAIEDSVRPPNTLTTIEQNMLLALMKSKMGIEDEPKQDDNF